MKTITAEEFKKKYSESAYDAFQTTPKPTNVFNTSAAKDVFNRAGADVSLAQQYQAEQGNSLSSTIRTGATMALQGGLSVPRAIGAGFFGEGTKGGEIAAAGVDKLGQFGEAITPDVVQKKVGQTALDVISGYENANPQRQLDQRNKLAVAEVLSYFLGSEAVKSTATPVASTLTNATKNAVKAADEVVNQGKGLKQNIRALVGENSLDDQVKTSVKRVAENPLSTEPSSSLLKGTSKRVDDVVGKYDKYYDMSEAAINDIKADPAIAEVGSKIGDAFESVIKTRQEVGKVLGEELKQWGKLKVDVQSSYDDFLAELKDSGLSYNPRTRQLNIFNGTRFAADEVDMIQQFMNRMRLLGESPTIKDIDNFISRTRSELAFTKGKSGVMGATNAERIINKTVASLRESLNPEKNGIAQLNTYWKANKTYSDLSDFVEEGSGFLGKKTQSGDFSRDASIAKSSVQSILNGGKKDWLIRLEQLTDYAALDDAVLALQAMKDAGDYRGLSLLQAIKDSGLPTSKAGAVSKVVDYAVEKGSKLVAGTPKDRTRAFLKTLNKAEVDLRVPDKKVIAGKNVPRTKEISALEEKIAKNVDSQKAAIKVGDFELVAKLKEAYSKLVTELKTLIADYKKNGIPLGMSIRKSVTPESVAKKADKQDIKFLAAVIDDVKAAKADPEANRILDAMGLGKATDDELVAFAKDVIDEADIAQNRVVIANEK